MTFGCCIREAENIRMLKQLGFDYYEFAGFAAARMDAAEFDRLCAVTERVGLPCLGFNAYCSGRPAIVGPDFNAREIRSYAEKICSRGAQLGIRSIGIGAPRARRLSPQYSREKAMQECRTFLAITGEIAENYSLRVLFESVHDRMCDFANTIPEALAVLEGMERDVFGLVLDFYHLEVMGENLDVLASASPWLSHVHVSSCEADLGRSFPQESELPLYSRRFYSLQQLGYHGSVSIEADHFEEKPAARSLQMLREAAENAAVKEKRE